MRIEKSRRIKKSSREIHPARQSIKQILIGKSLRRQITVRNRDRADSLSRQITIRSRDGADNQIIVDGEEIRGAVHPDMNRLGENTMTKRGIGKPGTERLEGMDKR